MLQGVGVSPGVGIGRAVVIAEGSLDYTQVHFAGVQQEKARLRTAVQAFAQRTQAMADALRARLDGQEADILASQILMANDPALLAQTDSRIEAGECAEPLWTQCVRHTSRCLPRQATNCWRSVPRT